MTAPRTSGAPGAGTLPAAIVLLVIAAAPAAAHVGRPLAPHDLAAAWTLDPWVLLSILVPAWLYWRGTRRLWAHAGAGRGVHRWQRRCFAGGIAALFVALVSPIDQLGGALFSAHMTQHQLLMIVAAPLLVLGAPWTAVLWAFSPPRRRVMAGWGMAIQRNGAWRLVSHPVIAWGLHAAAIWLWHTPSLYARTLDHELVHILQHLSFFGSALLFWWSVVHPRQGGVWGHGGAVLSVFTTAVHGSALGALLTFAATPWYRIYAGRVEPWGVTLLEDQQLGGLIMWVPAGFVYTAAALLLFGRWLRVMERRTTRRPSGPLPARDGSAGAFAAARAHGTPAIAPPGTAS